MLGGVCECGDCKVWIDEDIGLVPIASVYPYETMMGLELWGVRIECWYDCSTRFVLSPISCE